MLLNSHLDGDAHISAIVRACNFHLYQLERVRCYISDETCHLVVLALVISGLDYCNALLVGASQHQLDKLQRLQNCAARLVVRPRTPRRAVHVTPILQVLYKLCVLVHYCVYGLGPPYLSELLQYHVRDSYLHQPSAMQPRLHQPRRRVGRSGLGVAGPQVWNSLPASLRETSCISDLKVV